jgi:DHA2 family multidrug resistance protein
MTAFFAGRFGRKNYLTFSIFLFIGASFMCGISHSLFELVLWRIVQGAGGAALMSTAQATLRQIFPPEEQGIVQAIFILGIIVAPTLGPALGGWITDNYTWNWCFFINVPIGLASAFLVTSFLHDPPGMRIPSLSVDYLGALLLTIGLGSLQYVLEEGQQNDWFNDPTILRVAIVSGAALAGLLFWELTPLNKHPIVDLRILRNRQLSMSIVLLTATGFALYGGVYLYPLFTQTVLGFTPTQTGLVLVPGGVLSGVGAIFCGKVLNGRKPLLDPRVLIVLGIAIFTVSMWQLGHLTLASGEDDTRLALLVRGLGLGFLTTPINQVAYASVNPREAQQASGLINLSRQLGGSFGIAILGTYLTNQSALHRANLVSHLTNANSQLPAWLRAAQGGLMAHGYSHSGATRGAMALLDANVNLQAQVMSYNDSFLLILLIFIAVLPAVFLLRGMPTTVRTANLAQE